MSEEDKLVAIRVYKLTPLGRELLEATDKYLRKVKKILEKYKRGEIDV